jgi:endonuclease/exonuclease/phosphatase family metal-dependent hydrolase
MMRLVTYNIHKGIGGNDRRYNLERIIDVLAALEADFLCLQEVTIDLPRTSRHDQADLLAKRFQPMFATFQQNVHWKVGGYGNLLLARASSHLVAVRTEEAARRAVGRRRNSLRFTAVDQLAFGIERTRTALAGASVADASAVSCDRRAFQFVMWRFQ